MTPSTPKPLVIHQASRQRFEVQVDDQLAFLSYQLDGSRAVMDHTYVPETLRGRGLAGVLARAALEEAQRQGWKVMPRCSFVAAFLERHPEFAALTDGSR